MIVSGFLELISIGTIIPFLSSIAAPEIILEREELSSILNTLSIKNKTDLILFMTILFSSFALISALVRIINLRMMTFFAFRSGHETGVEVFSTILNKDFIEIQQFPSGEILNSVTRKADSVIYENLFPALTLLNSIVLGSMILILLLIMEPFVTSLAFIFITTLYLLINFYVRARLFNNSQVVVSESNRIIMVIQDSLGAIRDVILYKLQKSFVNEYESRDLNLRETQANNQIISTFPKFLVEAMGMVVLAWVGLIYARSSETSQLVIPVLGALAFGVQKLLPLVQLIFSSLSNLKAGSASLDDILKIISSSGSKFHNDKIPALEFKNNIKLTDISFRYGDNENPLILDNINLIANKGQRIGIVGVTGSGKSTLVDIISGLLTPTAGTIVVDGNKLNPQSKEAWQSNIAYVHQSIYIINGTILENLSFLDKGSEINKDWANQCIKAACLDQEVLDKYGIDTKPVGDRGHNLSGGQRQRLGLARALYRNARVLILDEATSSVDYEMEKKIMTNIYRLDPNITILIIAHRLESLDNCEIIWNVEKGLVKVQGR
ncbi:ABC transporter ATP-binding protein/permease [Gammaproteobacteria bacterium]|nr:ABC transporter ATP-binding protein/permease [Gammaproteobacteria bacterium]